MSSGIAIVGVILRRTVTMMGTLSECGIEEVGGAKIPSLLLIRNWMQIVFRNAECPVSRVPARRWCRSERFGTLRGSRIFAAVASRHRASIQ